MSLLALIDDDTYANVYFSSPWEWCDDDGIAFAPFDPAVDAFEVVVRPPVFSFEYVRR